MIFDIYVPALNIIFEYQGYQHYYDHCMFGDVNCTEELDRQKRLVCAEQNISYLAVPYWWQRDKESVIAIIKHIRPDLIDDALIVTPFHYT